MEWIAEQNPIVLALAATLFTWFVTAMGAGLVIFAKQPSQKFMDASLGMAAGVMTAASFWSLLAPAIDMAEQSGYGAYKWVPPLVGFLLGAGMLRVIDKLLPHMHPDLKIAEGVKTSWQRSTLLVLAITIHNIPEGLAVGVAFGAAASMMDHGEKLAQIGAAVALAIGIGLQNFPEGTAVSLPLRREGLTRAKSFWYGQLSGMVEPVAGVLGALAVITMAAILPYALAFAAGAMIFVVVEELVPESQRNGNVDLATLGAIVGFAIMMTLDVALG
ncbi:MAG: ZIP family metal transporter [Phycisphaerae bacterium]|nr:ZIP family metal transporter [Phycisphaerae bacterium]